MSQTSLTELLHLASPPVAIAFVDAAPPGVPHVSVVEAAGCGYWRRAAEGEVFYTAAGDHKRCPVGAHTHNVTLPPAEHQELMGLVQTMVGLSYLNMEDVPRIPTRETPLTVAVYAPLAAAPVRPDVVLVRGHAHQLMLLAEAAQAAGVAGTGPTMGRLSGGWRRHLRNGQLEGWTRFRIHRRSPSSQLHFPDNCRWRTSRSASEDRHDDSIPGRRSAIMCGHGAAGEGPPDWCTG